VEIPERKFTIASVLYLILTKNCNYSCKYCPFPLLERNQKEVVMTPEIAQKGVDLWIEHIKEEPNYKNYSVILYGGEPLLNINTLKSVVYYIEKLERTKLSMPLRIMLDTNGSFIDEELAIFLRHHNIEVTVGCDGPKEINDIYRIDNKGKGTFTRTKKAIDLLVKNRVKVFASVAIVPESIGKIDNIVQFFQEIGVEKIGFNILRGRFLRLVHPEIDLERYYEQVARAMIQSFQNRKDKGYEYQMQKRFDTFNEKHFFPIDCGGYGNQLVIHPDGGISNCPFLLKTFGNVKTVGKNFRIWNVSVVKEWRKQLPAYNPNCRNCKVADICGGGCPWNALQTEGSLFKIDKAICVLNQRIFDTFFQHED